MLNDSGWWQGYPTTGVGDGMWVSRSSKSPPTTITKASWSGSTHDHYDDRGKAYTRSSRILILDQGGTELLVPPKNWFPV